MNNQPKTNNNSKKNNSNDISYRTLEQENDESINELNDKVT